MIRLRCLLLALLWPAVGLYPATGGAHITATGLAIVTVDGREAEYRLTLVPAELPEDAGQLLIRAMAGSQQDAGQVAEAMRRAVRLAIDGAPCRPGRIAIRDAGAGLKVRLDYALHCPTVPGHFELREDWAALFGEHYRAIVTVRAPSSGGEYLLDQNTPSLAIYFGVPSPSGLMGFIRLGVLHILTGYDHLLFLFALLAGAGGVWRVLGITSMFTLAHSITLSLAVIGLVHVPAAVIEPLIALSIIWVAVENMLGQGQAWRRFAVTFGFGLVHGLGFADALTPLALTGWPLVRALGGFNIGVELGQAVAILVTVPVILLVRRLTAAPLVYRTASLAVAAAGAYWFVERIGFS